MVIDVVVVGDMHGVVAHTEVIASSDSSRSSLEAKELWPKQESGHPAEVF